MVFLCVIDFIVTVSLNFVFTIEIFDNSAASKPKPGELIFQQKMFGIYVYASVIVFTFHIFR